MLPYPLGGLFLFQIALWKEHYLPPREHVVIGTCFKLVRPPQPEKGQRCKENTITSPLESVLGEQEKGRGPFHLGIELLFFHLFLNTRRVVFNPPTPILRIIAEVSQGLGHLPRV